MPYGPGDLLCPVVRFGGSVEVTAGEAIRETGRGRGSAVKVRGVVTGGPPAPSIQGEVPEGEGNPLSLGPLRGSGGWGSGRGCRREGVPRPQGPRRARRAGAAAQWQEAGLRAVPAGGADRRFLRPPWVRDPASPGAAQPQASLGCPPETRAWLGRGHGHTGKARYRRRGPGQVLGRSSVRVSKRIRYSAAQPPAQGAHHEVQGLRRR